MRKLPVFLAVILIALAGASVLLPRSYEVSRRIVVDAPAAAVHAWVDDLGRWPRWVALWGLGQGASPPVADSTSLRWHDDRGVAWRLEVTFSDASRGLWCDLTNAEGQRPSKAALMFVALEQGTAITWVQRGELDTDPVSRLGGLFVEQRIGPDMQRSLDTLKRLIEGP